MKVEAKLGNTSFIMEDERHSNNLKITRINDKVTHLWIPLELIVEFAIERCTMKLKQWVRSVLV